MKVLTMVYSLIAHLQELSYKMGKFLDYGHENLGTDQVCDAWNHLHEALVYVHNYMFQVHETFLTNIHMP